MRQLPHWVLTDSQPAFYDSESATAIQQTAKLWAAVQELTEHYNQFTDDINKDVTAAIQFMRDHLDDSVVALLNQLLEEQAITVDLHTVYDDATEALTIELFAKWVGEDNNG